MPVQPNNCKMFKMAKPFAPHGPKLKAVVFILPWRNRPPMSPAPNNSMPPTI